VPGHVGALVSAYPELGFSDQEDRYTGYGIQKAIINPAAKNTIPFLNNLVSEITEVFQSDKIHLGGGEVRYDLWMDNPDILDFIEKSELTHPQQLHGLFTIQLLQMMEELDKEMILWDNAYRPEINDGRNISYMASEDYRSSFGIADKGFRVISGIGWSLDKQRNSQKLYRQSPYESSRYYDSTPDTSSFLRYDLSGVLAGQKLPSVLVIFGEDPSRLSGYVSLANKIYSFEGARLDDTRLLVTSDHTKGAYEAAFDLSDADNISGVLSLDGFSLNLIGKKTGGSDMENGLKLPGIPQSPILKKPENIKGGVAIVRTAWLNQTNILNKIRSSTEAISASMWNQQKLSSYDFIKYFSQYQSFSTALNPSNHPLTKFQNSSFLESSLPVFLSLLEENSEAKRFADKPGHNSNSHLNQLVDAISSESITASYFSALVETIIDKGSDPFIQDEIANLLESWTPIYRSIKSELSQNTDLIDMEVLALSLSDLSKIAKHVMESGTLTEDEADYYTRLSANAKRDINGIYLGPAKSLIKLIDSYRNAL